MALEQSEKTEMDFGSGGNSDKKVWKDILGAGQGVGVIRSVMPTADVVKGMWDEFKQAKQEFASKTGIYHG